MLFLKLYLTIAVIAIQKTLAFGKTKGTEATHDACKFSGKVFTEITIVIFLLENFDNFEDLNFKCQENKSVQYESIQIIEIEPNTQIALNDSLNLPRLVFQSLSQIILKSIAKIDISSRPFDGLVPSNTSVIELELTNSNFEFYHEHEIVDDEICYELMSKSNQSGIFASINHLTISGEVRFSGNICPAIFKNSNIFILCK